MRQITRPSTTATRLLTLAVTVTPLLLLGCTSSARSSDTVAQPASVGFPGAGTTAAATTTSDRGRIVEGPSSITSFRPKAAEPAVVDIETLDLAGVLESLGEDAILWYQHVQTLANPYFEGRVNGSAGTERARDYLEFYFRHYGLQPAFPAGDDEGGTWVSYRQPFEFSARGGMTVTVENAQAAVNDEPLDEGVEFALLGNSASDEVSGPVTFVGYGIDEGPEGYTSFDDDTDLTGRVALLLRYEPLTEEGTSRWAEERFSRNAGMAFKMRAVAERDAVGIILVNPPGCRDGRVGLEPANRSVRFGRALDIPVIQMTPAAVDRMLEEGSSADLMTWRRRADEGTVTTADLSDSLQVSFGGKVERSRSSIPLDANNVAAVLPGRGDLADEYLVIGGHYDHNGYGMFGTTPDDGPLFPGADDNASGTAGVLVLAKMLSEHYADTDEDDLRSVLFIAFDAEERGLHGSRHYATNPTVDPEQITGLLNMDMIGRLRSDQLSVLGVETAEGLPEILRPHFEASDLIVAVTPGGSGRSDDVNFDRVGVPALHFFTGMHAEYTSPADQAYTVNPIGAAKILDLMSVIAIDLVTRPDKLVHAEPGEDRTVDRQRAPTRDRGYAPVRLGIRPGMGENLETGILVEGVSPGTSADEGGMKAGDVMLRWDDSDLDGMRALVEMLRAHEPGDVVSITVQRDGREMTLLIKLKAGGG